VITILLMELVAVSLPLLIRRGVDAVAQGEPLRLVLQIAIVMLVAAALKAVLQFFGPRTTSAAFALREPVVP
jgi:hypothetical protein